MQNRYPLQPKSTNVQTRRQPLTTSPLKRSESPTKKSVVSSSPTKRVRLSPVKKASVILDAEPFKIFQDPEDYRSQTESVPRASSTTEKLVQVFRDSHISSTPGIADSSNSPSPCPSLSSSSSNKENPRSSPPNLDNKENGDILRNPIPQSLRTERRPLSDLNINRYPAFVNDGPEDPLSPMQQLKEPWSTNLFSRSSDSVADGQSCNRTAKTITLLPSYVTPPKRDRVISYKYQFLSDARSNLTLNLHQHRPMDESDIDSLRSQPFYIHKDI